jgi:hypothetical protein
VPNGPGSGRGPPADLQVVTPPGGAGGVAARRCPARKNCLRTPLRAPRRAARQPPPLARRGPAGPARGGVAPPQVVSHQSAIAPTQS